MAFTTKLDFSNNRQVKQHIETTTVLSGATNFGVPFSALPTGPNLLTSGETNTYTSVISTFSGNSATTTYNWFDPSMSLGELYLSAITPSNSATTQTVDPVFMGSTFTTIDGNTVALEYSGVSFDIVAIGMIDLGGGNYSGTVESTDLVFYSAATLDFTGRTIWADVSGITRTQDLIITSTGNIGDVWTKLDSEGRGYWLPSSGGSSGSTSSIWIAGTGIASAVLSGSGGVASGDYSIAEGLSTVATGFTAHAEGGATTASGDYSHAEGKGVIASGSGSHAEGGNTIASGIGSHAEGAQSIASGNYSHAEGTNTMALGSYSHAEGYATTATTDSTHAEGYNTLASGNFSHAQNQDTIASGASSHAEGISTQANGNGTHAEGQGTIANGFSSHAEGDGGIADGYASHSEGYFTIASGYVSHAEGQNTIASGGRSPHAEGSGTVASGDTSHAQGVSTIAGGTASHSEGSSTQAIADSAHAEGYNTLASGNYSHAQGNATSATTLNSHAEGRSTLSSGISSHSEGSFTIASGDYSHAQGQATIASGVTSHAGGNGSHSLGDYSFTHGQSCRATANSAWAVGGATSATTAYAGSQGYLTLASGYASFAGGKYSIAKGDTSFVYGSGSTADADYTYVLGNGISATTTNTTYVDYLNVKRILATAFSNDIRIDANGNLTTNTSDERLKENIAPLTGALEKVKALQGVTYQWKDRYAGGDNVRLGFIAQQVESVEPLLVFTNKDEDGYKGLHIDGVIPLLVEAIKELSTGTTSNKFLETQTILAEDNNIDLNYNGTKETAVEGGIRVLHAKGLGLSAELVTDSEGNWVTNNNFKPNTLTIPEYTPTSSNDENGNLGNISRDEDYIYIKTTTGWKRSNLENF